MKRRVSVIFTLLFLFALKPMYGQIFAENKVEGEVWKLLAETRYKNGRPQFSKSLKKFDKKKVSVKGYIYPLSEGIQHSHFVLTSLPTSACYFCGVGGPETIIEVLTIKGIKFTKKVIELEGILILDPDSDSHLTVMLIDASEVR